MRGEEDGLDGIVEEGAVGKGHVCERWEGYGAAEEASRLTRQHHSRSGRVFSGVIFALFLFLHIPLLAFGSKALPSLKRPKSLVPVAHRPAASGKEARNAVEEEPSGGKQRTVGLLLITRGLRNCFMCRHRRLHLPRGRHPPSAVDGKSANTFVRKAADGALRHV